MLKRAVVLGAIMLYICFWHGNSVCRTIPERWRVQRPNQSIQAENLSLRRFIERLTGQSIWQNSAANTALKEDVNENAPENEYTRI